MSTLRAIDLQEQAWMWQARGELTRAFDATREALGLVESIEGPSSIDAANLLNELAELARDQHQLETAVAFAERALAAEASWTKEISSNAVRRVRLKTATLLGELRRMQGNYALAEMHLLLALSLACEFGDAAEEAALARNELGVLYKYWGRFADAQLLFERALVVLGAVHGEESLEVGAVLHNIGGAWHAQGRFGVAAEPSRRAWAISRRQLGADHPRTLADAAAYAAVLDGLERHAESEVICAASHAAAESMFGPDHPEVAANLHNLAAAVEAQGRAAEAEGYYRRALALKLRVLGEEHPDVALTRNNLGRLLSETDRADEAVPLLDAAVRVLDARLVAGHPQRLAARQNLRRAFAAAIDPSTRAPARD